MVNNAMYENNKIDKNIISIYGLKELDFRIARLKFKAVQIYAATLSRLLVFLVHVANR
jgi:hypothetical protein